MQRGEVLAKSVRRHCLAIAIDVERARDDLTLTFRELARIFTTAAASLFRLTIGLIERADAHEVNVRLRFLTVAAVVARARVIRDQVARLELQLLEEERVPGAHFAQPLAPRVQGDRLLRAAVHR